MAAMRVSKNDMIWSPGVTSRIVSLERITITVGVALRRPEISALNFVAKGLVLIDPPIAHVKYFTQGTSVLLSKDRFRGTEGSELAAGYMPGKIPPPRPRPHTADELPACKSAPAREFSRLSVLLGARGFPDSRRIFGLSFLVRAKH